MRERDKERRESLISIILDSQLGGAREPRTEEDGEEGSPMNFSTLITKVISVLVLLIISTGSSTVFCSDPVPAPEQAGPIAIVGATIHPVERAPIVNGTILFDRGQIVTIGTRVQIPEGCPGHRSPREACVPRTHRVCDQPGTHRNQFGTGYQ